MHRTDPDWDDCSRLGPLIVEGKEPDVTNRGPTTSALGGPRLPSGFYLTTSSLQERTTCVRDLLRMDLGTRLGTDALTSDGKQNYVHIVRGPQVTLFNLILSRHPGRSL